MLASSSLVTVLLSSHEHITVALYWQPGRRLKRTTRSLLALLLCSFRAVCHMRTCPAH